jgi:hypothetical protein
MMVAAIVVVGVVLAVAIVVAVAGWRRFRALVSADVRSLFSKAAASVGSEQLRARWDGLPEPIRRYLRYAIPEGAPAIRTLRLKHNGFFRTKPDQAWFRIEGEQYFTAAQPGFVWNASIWPVPFLWVEARDCLLSRRGNMLVKFVSILPIADARGAEIDQGSSLRWLAECAWFPYAFVGDQAAWEPIDARSARVTLRHGGLPVSAVVDLDDEGRLSSLRAERYRDVGGGKTVLTPWIGRYLEYRGFNGLLVPSFVEVLWVLQGRELSYARFRVTALEYNVATRF